jgi:hypothetical protein
MTDETEKRVAEEREARIAAIRERLRYHRDELGSDYIELTETVEVAWLLSEIERLGDALALARRDRQALIDGRVQVSTWPGRAPRWHRVDVPVDERGDGYATADEALRAYFAVVPSGDTGPGAAT